MPKEKWRHWSRRTIVDQRVRTDGNYAAKMTVSDLFVPEGFEKGDPQCAGVVDTVRYETFNNEVAMSDGALFAARELTKGIPPKEVEEQ